MIDKQQACVILLVCFFLLILREHMYFAYYICHGIHKTTEKQYSKYVSSKLKRILNYYFLNVSPIHSILLKTDNSYNLVNIVCNLQDTFLLYIVFAATVDNSYNLENIVCNSQDSFLLYNVIMFAATVIVFVDHLFKNKFNNT